ncbi:tetratricopeptide repeat protein [Candidatus Babeliales bacterium]|nr:tetratricopeptide repeat protein [Candidatus Babeliales bacterium]
MKSVLLSFACSCLILSLHAYVPSYHSALWAQYNNQLGNDNTAFNAFQESLQNAQSPDVYKGFIDYLFTTHRFQAVVMLMSQLDHHFQHDDALQLQYAQALEFVGNSDAAYEKTLALLNKNPHHFETVFYAATEHAQHNNPKEALQLIDDYLTVSREEARHCLLYFLRAQIQMTLKNHRQALEDAQKSVALHPLFDKGWLLLGLLHEQQGRIKEALSGYTAFLELTGPDPSVEHQIAQLLLHKDSPPPNNKMVLIKVNALATNNQLTDAFSLLESWMNKEPENPLWFKAGHLIVRGAEAPANLNHIFMTTLQRVSKKHPNAVVPKLYLVDLYLRTHAPKKALTLLESMITAAKDPHLKASLLYQASAIHYQTGNFTHMKTLLDQTLTIIPAHKATHNLLAYYYATDGKNIKQAQQHLDAALRDETHNPHFLDTQAIIWMREKKYKQAHALLEELAISTPNDFHINHHLALTHKKLKHKKESREYANKALSLAHNEHERALCKKLLKRH